MKKFILLIIFGIFVGAGGLITFDRIRSDAAATPYTLQPGDKVANFSLTSLSDSASTTFYSINEAPGLVAVTALATCGGCQADLLKADEVLGSMPTRKLVGIIFAADLDQARSGVRGVTVSFPLYWASIQHQTKLGTRTFPAAALIDGQHQIQWRAVGPAGIVLAGEEAAKLR